MRHLACIFALILAMSAFYAIESDGAAAVGLDVTYEAHERIVILGDEGFTAENGVRSGSGTPLDPYVIEGWEIDLSEAPGSEAYEDGLVIQNTRSYVLVRDMWFHSGKDTMAEYDGHPAGIFMWNAWTVTFENCMISNTSQGIHMSSCRFISIEDCLVADCQGGGIYSFECDRLRVSDSVIARNSGGGIDMSGTEYSELVDSTITGSDHWIGVNLLNANNCSVRNCNVTLHENIGINIGFSEDCNVSGNLIEGNGVGLCRYGSERITLESNIYVDNENDITDYSDNQGSWIPIIFIAFSVAIITAAAIIYGRSRAKDERK